MNQLNKKKIDKAIKTHPLKKRIKGLFFITFILILFPLLPYIFIITPESYSQFEIALIKNITMILFGLLFLVFLVNISFLIRKTKTAFHLIFFDLSMMGCIIAWASCLGHFWIFDEYQRMPGLGYYFLFGDGMALLGALYIYHFFVKIMLPFSIEKNPGIWDFNNMLYSDCTVGIRINEDKWYNNYKFSMSIIGFCVAVPKVVNYTLTDYGFYALNYFCNFIFINIGLTALELALLFSLTIKLFQLGYIKNKQKNGNIMLVKELII